MKFMEKIDKDKPLIFRVGHGYYGGVFEMDVFPTVTTRTGDGCLDLILELWINTPH